MSLRTDVQLNQLLSLSCMFSSSRDVLLSQLLRCFPHCCPSHVSRGYCGCPLHLLVTFTSAAAAEEADHDAHLVVCARFEAAVTTAVSGADDAVMAMTPNSVVALSASALLAPSESAEENDWVRAEKASDEEQQQFAQVSTLDDVAMKDVATSTTACCSAILRMFR